MSAKSRTTAIVHPRHGRVTLTLDTAAGAVWATTPALSLGGWNLDRFAGGRFGAEWARQWLAAVTAPVA